MSTNNSLVIRINYYESGYCQLHAKIVEGQYSGYHVCIPDMIHFDPEDLPECHTLNWHTVSDPNGYAEPCSPVKKEVIERFVWEGK